MVSVLFALLTALFNGLASVLQRMAASTAPAAKTLHLSLFSYLIKRKVWLAGIGMVVVASVCQAIALATGPVALVQPIFIIELPFTLLVASRLAHRKLPQRTWWAVGLVTVALGAGLAAAAPSGGGTSASLKVWVAALIVTACFEAIVITIGIRTSGNARGAAFGLAAACGYALTATLLKSAVAALDISVAAFFSSWELYGTAIAGVGALFLLQNALQAGSLVAVQPPLTLGDAIISACFGVTVLGENVNTGGGLLAIEIVAVLAIAVGCIELSRSLQMVHQVQPAELPVHPALITTLSLALAGLLAGWPQRAVIGRLDVSPRPPALAAGAVTAVLLATLAARVHPALVLAAACWLAACAVPLAFTDVAVQRLPDPLTGAAYAGTAVLLLAAAAVGGPWSALFRALLGGLALAGFYLLLMVISPSGMSPGDVKLAASLGTLLAWFGWRLLIAGGLAGLWLGALCAAALLVSRRAARKQLIPFGPFMIAGAVLAVLVWPR